jgi:hypothetical protein
MDSVGQQVQAGGDAVGEAEVLASELPDESPLGIEEHCRLPIGQSYVHPPTHPT